MFLPNEQMHHGTFSRWVASFRRCTILFYTFYILAILIHKIHLPLKVRFILENLRVVVLADCSATSNGFPKKSRRYTWDANQDLKEIETDVVTKLSPLLRAQLHQTIYGPLVHKAPFLVRLRDRRFRREVETRERKDSKSRLATLFLPDRAKNNHCRIYVFHFSSGHF